MNTINSDAFSSLHTYMAKSDWDNYVNKVNLFLQGVKTDEGFQNIFTLSYNSTNRKKNL